MTVAEKLIHARGTKTREIVANAVGISVSAIGMYETGARIPRDEIKVKLADYFGTSVQTLFLTKKSQNAIFKLNIWKVWPLGCGETA